MVAFLLILLIFLRILFLALTLLLPFERDVAIYSFEFATALTITTPRGGGGGGEFRGDFVVSQGDKGAAAVEVLRAQGQPTQLHLNLVRDRSFVVGRVRVWGRQRKRHCQPPHNHSRGGHGGQRRRLRSGNQSR